MRKTFINTVEATDLSVAVVGLAIFNPSVVDAIAGMELQSTEGVLLSTIMQMNMAGKETVFLSTKVFLEPGQKLVTYGAEFTMAGSVG